MEQMAPITFVLFQTLSLAARLTRMAIDDYLLTGDVAKLCGVTPAAVRQWERAGKLKAAAKTAGGVRLFTHADVIVCDTTRFRKAWLKGGPKKDQQDV